MPKTGADPATVLDAALQDIRKQYGDGAVMALGQVSHADVPVIPTGSMGLDAALGLGGIPRGRVTEIYGQEGTGKTTLGLQLIANAQRAGGVAVMIDAEHALDPDYARAIGVDTDRLLVSQPDCGEEGLEIADKVIRTGAVAVVLIDSVAALVPRAEIEGEMGAYHVGAQARLMSQALRKITAGVGNTKTSCVFINQLRDSIGMSGYGPKETTTGGKALKFYASVRLDVRRKEQIKAGEQAIGNRVLVRVVKNKLSPPFRSAEFDIIWGKGISQAGELLDYGVLCGAVAQSGAYYSVQGSVIAQGRANARAAIEAMPEETRAVLEKAVRERMFPVSTPVSIDQEAVHE